MITKEEQEKTSGDRTLEARIEAIEASKKPILTYQDIDFAAIRAKYEAIYTELEKQVMSLIEKLDPLPAFDFAIYRNNFRIEAEILKLQEKARNLPKEIMENLSKTEPYSIAKAHAIAAEISYYSSGLAKDLSRIIVKKRLPHFPGGIGY